MTYVVKVDGTVEMFGFFSVEANSADEAWKLAEAQAGPKHLEYRRHTVEWEIVDVEEQ